MQWYYSKNGAQNGPVSLDELKAKIASGEVGPRDVVWKEGMADWVPAGEVGDLRSLFGVPAKPVEAAAGYAPPSATEVAPPSSSYPTSQQSQSTAYHAPGGYGATAPYAMPPSQGMAVASMICGIIGLLTCCLWCLNIPLAIVAVVLGHIALSKVKSQPDRYAGAGKAKAGLVTGYLGLLAALVFGAFSVWVQTLSPEKIEQMVEQMEWMPQADREKIIRDLQKNRQQQDTEGELPSDSTR